jgi:Domain of unknown function (DUF4124)
MQRNYKNRICFSFLAALFLTASFGAHAIEKCTDAQGKITFSDRACPADHRAVTQAVRKSSAAHPVDEVVLATSAAAARGDFDAMRSTSAKPETFDQTPAGKGREQMLALVKYVAPIDVAIASREISRDGLQATVLATGKYRNLATEMLEPTKGKITLVRMSGVWKVLESEWGPNKW